MTIPIHLNTNYSQKISIWTFRKCQNYEITGIKSNKNKLAINAQIPHPLARNDVFLFNYL